MLQHKIIVYSFFLTINMIFSQITMKSAFNLQKLHTQPLRCDFCNKKAFPNGKAYKYAKFKYFIK